MSCTAQRPGTSRPAMTQGQVSSRRRQPREPWGDGQTQTLQGTPLCTRPSHLCPSLVAHRPNRVGVAVPREESLTVLTSGEVGIGREQSLAGWQRWLWRRDLRRRSGVRSQQPGTGTQLCRESWKALDSVKANLGTKAHTAQRWLRLRPSSPMPWPWSWLGASTRFGSHLLHRAGCTVPAAANTRGGGGGDALRAGAEMVRCGAGQCSSLPHQFLRRCYSSHHLPPPRSCCGPAPEMSSRLSGEEKADGC